MTTPIPSTPVTPEDAIKLRALADKCDLAELALSRVRLRARRFADVGTVTARRGYDFKYSLEAAIRPCDAVADEVQQFKWGKADEQTKGPK